MNYMYVEIKHADIATCTCVYNHYNVAKILNYTLFSNNIYNNFVSSIVLYGILQTNYDYKYKLLLIFIVIKVL